MARRLLGTKTMALVLPAVDGSWQPESVAGDLQVRYGLLDPKSILEYARKNGAA